MNPLRPPGPLRPLLPVLAAGVALLVAGACRGNKGAGAPPSEARAREAAATTSESDAPRHAVDAGAALSRDEICAATPVARTSGLSGAKPFTDLDAHCIAPDYFCDSVEKSPDPKATCFVANDNIARAERESRAARGDKTASSPRDGSKPPKYLDRIDAHLHLTREERAALASHRFVVLDRLAYSNYAHAFHDIFQEQLPLFVGVDPILHAVFRGTELALERVERKRLVPALAAMLRKLRGGLAASAAGMDAQTRGDLDVYLGVAAGLAAPPAYGETRRLSVLRGGDDAAIAALVEAATGGQKTLTEVALFGRSRMIDFSQLEPRGHYLTGPGASDGLEGYFRSVMWLSRVELNLISRSSRSSHPGPGPDPRETPREVKDALALAELASRTGASAELRAFDDVYTTFAGRREDVPPEKLLEIARAKGLRSSDPEVAAKLRSAVGDGFKRTARTHFTVEGAPDLPAILTLLGPRVVPDVAPLTRLVHDAVPDRKWLAAADAGHVLGHDRARAFLPDFDRAPGLPQAFAGARAELRANAAAAKDIYGSWLRAVLAIADRPTGVLPSFTTTDAYADHRLNSALVGYGQIRHAFVLLAAQGYDAYGCEIPDAYVEPLPAVFDALLAHVRKMRTLSTGWKGLERVIATLAAIAHDETNGRTLTEPQRRWLAMVSEHIANGGYVSTGEPPKWTGWYFDMFEDREHGATSSTSFIADYFTLTNAGEIAYLGAEGPRLGVFIVDTNGEPRAMVGPVAKGFETHAPIAGRLADDKVFDAATTRTAPWRASYAVPARPDPALGLEGAVVRCEHDWRVAVRSLRAAAGPTSVTLLDHHGDPLSRELVLDVDDGWKVGAFALSPELVKARYGVEALHVRVADLARSGAGVGSFDYTTSPSVFAGLDYESTGTMPKRPTGPGYFTIGGLPSAAKARP